MLNTLNFRAAQRLWVLEKFCFHFRNEREKYVKETVLNNLVVTESKFVHVAPRRALQYPKVIFFDVNTSLKSARGSKAHAWGSSAETCASRKVLISQSPITARGISLWG
jgi:hypothetical protein